jgi:hypothetical protein
MIMLVLNRDFHFMLTLMTVLYGLMAFAVVTLSRVTQLWLPSYTSKLSETSSKYIFIISVNVVTL